MNNQHEIKDGLPVPVRPHIKYGSWTDTFIRMEPGQHVQADMNLGRQRKLYEYAKVAGIKIRTKRQIDDSVIVWRL